MFPVWNKTGLNLANKNENTVIIDHSSKPTTGFFDRSAKVVQCGTCKKQAKPGADIDEAIVLARKAGFSTVPGPTVVDPMDWSCLPCREKA